MKNRYILECFYLDRFHYRDPGKQVWKIYNLKSQKYIPSCYDTEEAGQKMLKMI